MQERAPFIRYPVEAVFHRFAQGRANSVAFGRWAGLQVPWSFDVHNPIPLIWAGKRISGDRVPREFSNLSYRTGVDRG
jgi:hypothetical protein